MKIHLYFTYFLLYSVGNLHSLVLFVTQTLNDQFLIRPATGSHNSRSRIIEKGLVCTNSVTLRLTQIFFYRKFSQNKRQFKKNNNDKYQYYES